MKQWTEIIRQLTVFTQFGLSLVTPLLICMGLCWLAVSKAGMGGWVFIPGFFFGLGGSATFAWKFYQSVISKNKKEEKQRRGRSFNRH